MKLLKKIKIRNQKPDMNGLTIVELQAYGEKAYRDKSGYNKSSPYYDVEFYFLKAYKGTKQHRKVYGYNNLLKPNEILREMNKIKRQEL